MSLRKALDESFESGRQTALRGIPANAGHCSGKDARYYDMAYYAGYQAALSEIARLSQRVAESRINRKAPTDG